MRSERLWTTSLGVRASLPAMRATPSMGSTGASGKRRKANCTSCSGSALVPRQTGDQFLLQPLAPGLFEQRLEVAAVPARFQFPHHHGAARMQLVGSVE